MKIKTLDLPGSSWFTGSSKVNTYLFSKSISLKYQGFKCIYCVLQCNCCYSLTETIFHSVLKKFQGFPQLCISKKILHHPQILSLIKPNKEICALPFTDLQTTSHIYLYIEALFSSNSELSDLKRFIWEYLNVFVFNSWSLWDFIQVLKLFPW